MMMVYVLASTAVQSIMPDQLRGRVTALLGATFAVFPVGTLIVGSLAERFGAQEAVVAITVAFGLCLLALHDRVSADLDAAVANRVIIDARDSRPKDAVSSRPEASHDI